MYDFHMARCTRQEALKQGLSAKALLTSKICKFTINSYSRRNTIGQNFHGMETEQLSSAQPKMHPQRKRENPRLIKRVPPRDWNFYPNGHDEAKEKSTLGEDELDYMRKWALRLFTDCTDTFQTLVMDLSSVLEKPPREFKDVNKIFDIESMYRFFVRLWLIKNRGIATTGSNWILPTNEEYEAFVTVLVLYVDIFHMKILKDRLDTRKCFMYTV
jgi:hypothetical protein